MKLRELEDQELKELHAEANQSIQDHLIMIMRVLIEIMFNRMGR